MKNIFLIIIISLSTNLFALLPISQQEEDGLIWLLESTKLSKDIYNDLHEIWNIQLFSSIELVEDRDYKSIEKLLDKYLIKNPIKSIKKGEYSSPYISKLYSDFSQKYDDSEYEALRIAATLEDLMISDINDLLETSTNEEFINLFTTLRYSAISHIRGINNLMKKKYKVEYQAQFLSILELKNIL
ncbi:DUF2202 domain-containing protein [Thiospirochaeta perfilievii]|uniref:DUF2202 domain-containing protein n=1 Tax=Thiospirochaeta perfilievii TaxID=252967 RepID=A0A5C1Q741_9SPIO|nr:DUF2202 domain-containing protein [Thiospirochaeta perfilievii]QEN03178.1 DUF2202 domain-containing protein [Thiospirochaeta perfilievii]